jgi:serine/threonine protein kinase
VLKKLGKYKIVEEIGRGAMGEVYKASDPSCGLRKLRPASKPTRCVEAA